MCSQHMITCSLLLQPRTPLELEVAALLRGSDNVIHDKHKELTVAEQRALKAMDLDEVLIIS